MPTPSPFIPWPRLDRRAYLLLLDDQHRLLLCGGCCSGWTVPQVRINAGSDFRRAAVEFLAERFQLKDPRFESTYGLRQSRFGDNWEFDRVTATRTFIVRISDEQSREVTRKSASHTRWELTDLRRRRRQIHPEGVVLLTIGYVEGWIPDGPISLY